MKNKKNIYILLPIVLFIWGGVMYQFLSFTNYDEQIPNVFPKTVVQPLKIKERDTFSIVINNRDPFLGKIYAKQDSVKPKIKDRSKSTKRRETIVWPKIDYKGVVSDSKVNKIIYLVVIDGHDYFMKKGETVNGVYLKSGDKESIYVKYKGLLDLILVAE